MRKVIAATFVSVDGVMQAPGGPQEDPTGGFRYGGWTAPYFDETVGQAIGGVFAGAPFDLLLGRKTYEIFAAHWPYYEDQPDAEIAKPFNACRKYVATSSKAPLTLNNSVAIHDPAADVAKLKKENGPALLIQGSSVLIHTLLKHNLIDEIHLLTFPLILGKGKRLFGEDGPGTELKLVSSKASPSGVQLNTYVPSGPVKTGDFSTRAPSEAELARREKMKKEG
jgi:dihydrofolate reductase